MKKGIEKAVQMGIDYGLYGNPKKVSKFNWFIKDDLIHFDNGIDGVMISLHKQFLRPEFWEVIRLSLTFKQYTWHTYPGHSKIWNEHQTDDMGDNPYAKSETYAVRYITAVLMQHRFIDHINEGEDIESYFNELLK